MPKTKRKKTENEAQLPFAAAEHERTGGVGNLGETFRRLYYYLYSNSSASRAERILENLSALMMLKFSADKNGGKSKIDQFVAGGGSAADLLQPLLDRILPKHSNVHLGISMNDEALRGAFQVLSDVNLAIAPAHVLGEAFQSLIGPRMRGDKGQFFTPRSLVKAMVEIVAPTPAESVLDPACGTGGFLGEIHVFQMAQQQKGTKPSGVLMGVDKDADLARLATTLLHIGTGSRAVIRNANSLDASAWTEKVSPEDGLFDVVLTNPPFGTRIAVEEPSILRNYALGHNWVETTDGQWERTSAVLASQDPQILFIELCVQKLKPGGRMGIVLPEGVFGNKQQGYVWTWLREHGTIQALLDCPRTTFQPGTDTKTNVLFFKKHRGNAHQNGKAETTRIAVALTCGHDRRGRTCRPDGTDYPDDFSRLSHLYHAAGSNGDGWKSVVISNPMYLVPRYYVRSHSISSQEADVVDGATQMTVRDLVDAGLLTIRKGHEVGSEVYGSGDIPFVRTSDINNFEISADPTKAVSEEVYQQFRPQQKLKPGDILMVVDGRYRIGATALLTENNHRCVVQSHFRILGTPAPHKLSPYELLFALNLPSVRLRIRDLVFVQSTLGTLGKRILELELPILHGPGPWANRIRQFEELLRGRDGLLASLRSMSGPEYEL